MKNYGKKRCEKQEDFSNEGKIVVELPFGKIFIDSRAELLSTSIKAGLRAMQVMFNKDVEMICGKRYKHDKDKEAFRWGRTNGEVTLGGRKIRVRRPRVRDNNNKEVHLRTYEFFREEDPFIEKVLEQMLVGVSTRNYKKSLEIDDDLVASKGISRSFVSRRFIIKTMEQLEEFMNRSLSGLDLCAIFIDGKSFGEHVIISSRWRDGEMALRWGVTGLLEAEKKFRRIRGYREIPILINSLLKLTGNRDFKIKGSVVA